MNEAQVAPILLRSPQKTRRECTLLSETVQREGMDFSAVTDYHLWRCTFVENSMVSVTISVGVALWVVVVVLMLMRTAKLGTKLLVILAITLASWFTWRRVALRSAFTKYARRFLRNSE